MVYLASRRIMRFCCLTILIACTASAALGQTQKSVSMGTYGTLSYTATETAVSCGPSSGSLTITGSYERWTDTGFVYHDPSGATHSLTGTATYILRVGTEPTCPQSGGATVALSGSDYTIDFTPTTNGGGSASFQLVPGSITPKYMVLAVVYAPPGSKSSVDYGTSTMMGSSVSISNSFNNSNSLSISIGGSASIFGNGGSVTGTASTAFSQEEDSSTSIDISKTSSNDTVVPGPQSDAVGVDHDYDTIYIWLNPVVTLGFVPGGTISQGAFSYDMTDPCLCMDVISLQVAQLKNPALITDPTTLHYLARTWAQNLVNGSSPGLTNADLLQIAQADPFVANPSYTLTLQTQSDGSVCSTDQRFCSADNQDIPYEPPAPGGQPSTNKGSLQYSKTTTEGTGSTYTEQVGFSLDIKATVGFIAQLNTELKAMSNLTWTQKFSSTNTQKTGQTASWSVTGPAASANYTGPTLFDVFTDNVYGTFMFYPHP
jgi:hypothetical protein